jgi:hypothetical protein
MGWQAGDSFVIRVNSQDSEPDKKLSPRDTIILFPPMAKNVIGLFDFAQFFGIIPPPTRTISKIS